ncbi:MULTISPECIES: heavy metal translocating P-type ATPase [unclassified Bradyrhizobium]|uniref:heavy metal translocating P-type ATPase n=1 Tax=unclassified Bradyrhizobium TaxID=2631580 RepID=UPI001BA483E8|nr:MULTISPECIES: heavy metal translocating P-type ATPase [unclassified Bradyrhizobium]MBR1208147.1 cadmium-translocating P-type ATPase [Bradyrhizobium sp. AUGA SZCCT0124]MBR1316444.1 cadmium-translocating P-type ATPase [Bradyrhizobium sp. AUGA SZCCT0051]MBR1344661.1 cadmium-translocating P-type ATPase [Bradyrhizobium sp. AUGA SZCCT0105]MBR1359465.1 cadmium-translocating P-type ATPase [Bradyrhizobium sp. AUGA SZCCT0045]
MSDTLQTEKVRFRVDGMDCASCATKIENALQRMPGVTEVTVSVTGGTVTVRRGAGGVDADEIRDQISNLGYRVARPESDRSDVHGDDRGISTTSGESHSHLDAPSDQPWWKTRKGGLTIASGTALAVAFAIGKAFPAIEQWAFFPAMMVGLVPIAKRAVSAATAGTPFSIEMLMTIAAIGAVFIGATEEAVTVVFLFLIGELLEGVAASRARASIQDLTKLVPKTARLEEDGQVREVPADTLSVGAMIQVRPGDRIPADGVIVSGESSIDEAPVTGESTPVRKGRDETLFAGTVNGDGLLSVRVTAAAADNTIARVVKLVEEAQESKAPTERFIDRFSRYYTPGVVVVAALVAIIPPLVFGGTWSGWIYKGLAILLIGCPCALVISTPAAIAASLSAGARRGLLLKGGAVLEQIGKITIACFDKTGTLTAGKPQVTDIIAFERSEGDVLRFAAALESGSSHPLAAAILSRAADHQIWLPPTSNATAIGGKGVEATVEGIKIFLGSPKAVSEFAPTTAEQDARISALNDEGKTVALLVMDDRVAGAIAMRDEPRPDAKTGLKLLADAGIRTVMLTGDNRRTATAIGQQLGIDVEAELLPQDKQRIVGQFQKAGWSVAKIGDGINDAPALAAADVGIAMGGGTDVALETADAAVLHGRVSDVAAMVDLSKRTMTNIRQNITVALGLKAVFLVTTVVGLTGLWPAILADTGATVLVTLNALRLLRLPDPSSTGKAKN